MASIFIQAFKYIIMFLFLGYIFGAFYVFKFAKQQDKQKKIYIWQKIILYSIHGLGFLCLFLKSNNIEILGFYLMQVVLISVIFLFYHYMYKRCSVLLINNMCMLLVISMIILTRISFEQAFRQFVFLVIGAIGMLIIPLFLQKGSVFRNFSVLYYLAGIVLLTVVVVLGNTSYGAKLSITIGGISFQPSEFVKIIFVFFAASMLYKHLTFKKLIYTSILSATYVLVLVASRDLGGALLYFMAYLIMVFVATKDKRYLLVGAGGMGVAGVAAYFLFSHVRTRVDVWLNPTADIDNKGYQICQSLFGIGTGGWFGLGIGEGLPTKIPVVEKDFIFSAIAEEFGGIFAICLILLCLSCFIMIVNISMQMKDKFYKLVAIGLATLYGTQVILTIGGAIKFIPSTGVTLPLVSYGGSSLLSTLIVFGVVQGLYMRKASSRSHKATKDKKEKQVKNIEFNIVNYMFVAAFVSMILYMVYFMAFRSENFINNEYNGLQTLFEEDVVRGEIVTSDGYVIAETITKEDGSQVRSYPYGKLFSHVTGYSLNVRTGLEKQENFTLLRSHAFFLEQLLCDFSGEKKIGDNVITTVRYDLQQMANKALGNKDGAIIVMEPSTGKILAMVSKPNFDPNSINLDWEDIQEDSSLYNRATQGLYAPGSVFKIITTLAYIESNPDTYENYSYTCNGEIKIGNKTIHCASGHSHGEVDLQQSFAESCNTSYANMMQSIDEEILENIANALLFNTALPISFESSISQFALSDKDAEALKLDTAIGQGKTLVSPLHMAMLASAICNDGVAMRPYLCEQVENYKGIVVEETRPKEYAKLLDKKQVELLSQYMRSTIEGGTGSRLLKDAYTAYGKTGTAQTTSDLEKTNAWFVGYAEADGKEIAIAIVVENAGSGSSVAVPIAEKIFDLYFE